eukprot:352949-Chlamydomonas_euryale.AAC.9
MPAQGRDLPMAHIRMTFWFFFSDAWMSGPRCATNRQLDRVADVPRKAGREQQACPAGACTDVRHQEAL